MLLLTILADINSITELSRKADLCTGFCLLTCLHPSMNIFLADRGVRQTSTVSVGQAVH